MKIANELGIEIDITTIYARPTYTITSKRSGVPTALPPLVSYETTPSYNLLKKLIWRIM